MKLEVILIISLNFNLHAVGFQQLSSSIDRLTSIMMEDRQEKKDKKQKKKDKKDKNEDKHKNEDKKRKRSDDEGHLFKK